MSFLAAIPVIGDVLSGLFKLADQTIEDKDEKNRVKAQLTEMFEKGDVDAFAATIKAKQEIIVTEAKSEGSLARNWRPITMLSFVVIIINNYILQPWLFAMFGVNVMLPIPPEMWELLKLGLGGYVAGRTIEKSIQAWRDKGKE